MGNRYILVFLVISSLALLCHAFCVGQSITSQQAPHNPLYDSLEARYKSFNNRPERIQADSNITYVTSWRWGDCYTVDLKNNYAFIGNGFYVHVLDISRKDSQYIVGEYLTPSLVYDILVVDSIAFVLYEDYGISHLLLLDVSDVTSPRFVSDLSFPVGRAWQMAIRDSILFVASGVGSDGLGIYYLFSVDVSNRSAPFIRCSLPYACYTPNMRLYDNYLFLGFGVGCINIGVVDAHNPDSLRWLNDIPTRSVANQFTVHDTLMYLFDPRGKQYLRVLDISDPTNPIVLREDTLQFPFVWFDYVEVYNNTLYAGGYGSVYRFDLSDPTKPIFVDSLYRTRDPLHSTKIRYSDGYLFVASQTGLWTLRAPSADTLETVNFFLTGGPATGLTLRGTDLYVSQANAGLAIVDVADPLSPRRLGGVDLPSSSYSVTIVDDFAYVSTHECVEIVDVSDRGHPRHIGSFLENPKPSDFLWVKKIVIENSRAYVVLFDSTLRVFDITNPAAPNEIGRHYLNGRPNRIAVKDSVAYVTGSGSFGLRIFDVSDPANIIVLDSMFESSTGIAIQDTFLFVYHIGGGLPDGLTALSISNKRSPQILSTLQRPQNYSTSGEVAQNGAYIYLSLSLPFLIVDVSDILNMRIVGKIDTYLKNDIAIQGKYFFLPNTFNGVGVYKNDLLTTMRDISQDHQTSVSLSRNFPNPFNPRTTIEFGLLKTEKVVLRVYDVLGKEIATLVDDIKPQGYYRITWEPKGLPSGIYFYRVQTGSHVKTGKMVLMK